MLLGKLHSSRTMCRHFRCASIMSWEGIGYATWLLAGCQCVQIPRDAPAWLQLCGAQAMLRGLPLSTFPLLLLLHTLGAVACGPLVPCVIDSFTSSWAESPKPGPALASKYKEEP